MNFVVFVVILLTLFVLFLAVNRATKNSDKTVGDGDGKVYNIVSKTSGKLLFDGDGLVFNIAGNALPIRVVKENLVDEKTNDHCSNFPDKVTTFRLRMLDKTGDNYLRVSYQAGNVWDVKFTDKSGTENRWTTEIDGNLVSAAGIDAGGGRNPGLYPFISEDANGVKRLFYKIVSNCNETGENIFLQEI